ncbi:MAG TPA: FecR family protein [Gammaproteobacteria bacterium]|nr:FecR family protein [Gammaproteobacteria bacterium]
MSDQRDQGDDRELTLRRLFAHVTPRPQPPAADMEEVRQAVLAEWEAVTGRRTFVRRTGFAAAAAAALAAVLYVGGGLDPGVPATAVASVERAQGTVTTGAGMRLDVGSSVTRGTELVTGDGQAALRLASGGSLRVAARSRLVLTSEHEAELVAGTLYFDSEDERGEPFAVTTALGRIRDVGTQFLVRLDESEQRLDVGVREGGVVLARDGSSDSAGVGERLIATDQDPVRRETIATFGTEWEWAERLAPPFEIDGRTVDEFLAWFAAQTGRTVVYADTAAEREAREVLTGSIDLEPLQKLSAVEVLTDLTFTLEGDRVVVRLR